MNPTDELELSYELSGAKASGISFEDYAALRKMERRAKNDGIGLHNATQPLRRTVIHAKPATAPTAATATRSIGRLRVLSQRGGNKSASATPAAAVATVEQKPVTGLRRVRIK